jgi:hypothetical protein
MSGTRHFSELTKEEVMDMGCAMEMAAARYARKINMSGLICGAGAFNIYRMVQDGMMKEWRRSKRAGKYKGD